MEEPDSDKTQRPITRWLQGLRENNPSAAANLWNSFRHRLESLAKKELAKLPNAQTFDEEDIAISAFFTFYSHLQKGKFSALANRDELWWLLIVLTKRKAAERAKQDHALKRGAAAKQVSLSNSKVDPPGALDTNPEHLVAMREQCELLLEVLEDDELRMIAIWKLEGRTNDEIADQLKRTRQTVQRKLNLIRSIWSRELDGYDWDAADPDLH